MAKQYSKPFHAPATPPPAPPAPVVVAPVQTLEMAIEPEAPAVDFLKVVGTNKGKDVSIRNIGVLNGGVIVAIEGIGVTFIKDVYWNEQRNDFGRS